MRLFSSRLLWSGVICFVLFWAIVSATVYAISLKFPILDFPLIHETIGIAFATGHLEGLSSQDFAFALAAMIGTVALGLAVAYFIMHVVLISLAIFDASQPVTRARSSAFRRKL